MTTGASIKFVSLLWNDPSSGFWFFSHGLLLFNTFYRAPPKKTCVSTVVWCCLCCSPPFKQLPAAAGAMTASDQQQEVDSVSQAELPIGSMPPGSNKGRQKKFHRHFKTVSAEERVLNCKYPLCCFFLLADGLFIHNLRSPRMRGNWSTPFKSLPRAAIFFLYSKHVRAVIKAVFKQLSLFS